MLPIGQQELLIGPDRWSLFRDQALAAEESAQIVEAFRTIRVNLQHVPEAIRPAQEPLDPDENTFANS